MLLNRIGNKDTIAPQIIAKFPSHSVYIEPFFGAGGIFFNKPKSKYNILNDLDGDIFNLFTILQTDYKKLMTCLLHTPYSQELYTHWKTTPELDPFWKAVRFLYLSNFSKYGKVGSLDFKTGNTMPTILMEIQKTAKMLMQHDIKWMNTTYADMFRLIGRGVDWANAFIYCDPPYVGTTNNYGDGRATRWTIDDLERVIITMKDIKTKFAISEFESADNLRLATEHGLYVNFIAYKTGLKNYNKEILLTNYEVSNLFEGLSDEM